MKLFLFLFLLINSYLKGIISFECRLKIVKGYFLYVNNNKRKRVCVKVYNRPNKRQN